MQGAYKIISHVIFPISLTNYFFGVNLEQNKKQKQIFFFNKVFCVRLYTFQ